MQQLLTDKLLNIDLSMLLLNFTTGCHLLWILIITVGRIFGYLPYCYKISVQLVSFISLTLPR
jgi:hypothetical protein